ncbi:MULTISPECIES: DNA translocase FtsK [Caldilinea]|jgi:S-DNA-T family DNA segregation ATPase FtsK/SpoIIIE|uniref:DNA translocase FtsK n=1 Tax=Caldilinea aerophila (strain DSM 14535 / JCM 11387 / NBRC 104270 / STL-6-O1) TaxID=926550 RepID=I0I7H5_CALAS|nr:MULTISPECIES: DNA translocase FtsK [Caldilinea]MBO9391903.1 DNA translocase FtsK [Caldilinea sp.]BAM01213.1 DNA translocase FtsK [Caldilinea aerophila DSM 14535 = NBRC 104270]GIV72555.1 MAG: DNA translocase FtsK [Caldilinea sp.]
MASKSTRRKRSTRTSGQRRQPSSGVETLARSLLRAEVGGVLLALLAVFTLLSLLTPTRGQLTGGWVDFLRSLFGWGAWGVPLVLGIWGLWMVIRAIDQMPDLPWQRPAGLASLFIAWITAVSLLVDPELRTQMAQRGDAGGLVGKFLADALQQSIGTAGAWAFVSFLTVTGVFLLFDQRLMEAWQALQEWSAHREAHRTPTATLPGQPVMPMPGGVLPWWKRLFVPSTAQERTFVPPEETPQVRPTSPSASPSEANYRERNPAPKPASALRQSGPNLPLTKPIGEGELRPPRIVGGAQEWKLPPLDAILNNYDRITDDDNHIRMQGRLIQETLALFGVPADFEGAYKGPAVTQYLIKPGYVERKVGAEVQRVKVKVSKIAALANDLALALAAPSVRIEAPIPGTNYVGIEVPNQASNIVGLKELMESDAFIEKKRILPIALGEDVKGQPIITDLARMPHLLIAGATGSGKSVCINSIIACLLLTHTPDTLRLLMIDPKMVELSVYNGIPHLLSPVVTDVDKAAGVLFWTVKEMERRYALFSKANARDLVRYNAYLEKSGEKPLPYIVVIVDEMADLMMAAPEEVEKHICRLAQMARAVGIHLIIATQRPSVDVITGLIKANFPARIAFAVSSQTDSRVILDIPGAERLLGRGDMLFMAPDASKLERIQGAMVTDEEIGRLVNYWRRIRTLEGAPLQSLDLSEAAGLPEITSSPSASASPSTKPEQKPPADSERRFDQPPLFEQIDQLRAVEARDELFDLAVAIVREHGRGSVNLLQRKLRIGYTRASRLIEQLHEAGVLGPDLGSARGRAYLGEPGNARSSFRYIDADAQNNAAAQGERGERRWDDEADDDDEPFDADAHRPDDAPPWDDDPDDADEPADERKAKPAGGQKPAPPTIWF